jgi:hypothetical protein
MPEPYNGNQRISEAGILLWLHIFTLVSDEASQIPDKIQQAQIIFIGGSQLLLLQKMAFL